MTSSEPELPWSDLEVEISQDMNTAAIATNTVNAETPRGATFTIITHERGELPFSAYDRSIHNMITPATQISIYFSKSVTRRINTARNPCHEGIDAIWMSSTRVRPEEASNTTSAVVAAAPATATASTGVRFLDFLDRRRLNLKKQRAWPTANLPYLQTESLSPPAPSLGASVLQNVFGVGSKDAQDGSGGVGGGGGGGGVDRSLTVRLFNTELLYSREACGWALCCHKVARNCNCTCSMDWLLSTGTSNCPAMECEKSECTDSPILYDQCPMPCVTVKFIKQNSLVIGPADSGLPSNVSLMKLLRSENVQVATEEEIYSLAKLFSEIGGLCSLFIGFSCIFIFELIEAMLLFRSDKREMRVMARQTEKPPVYCCASEAASAPTRNGWRRKKRAMGALEENCVRKSVAKAETAYRNVDAASCQGDKRTPEQERKETVTITVMMRTNPAHKNSMASVSENEVAQSAVDTLPMADSQAQIVPPTKIKTISSAELVLDLIEILGDSTDIKKFGKDIIYVKYTVEPEHRHQHTASNVQFTVRWHL
ncbi:unnamed protein product [Schistocephalus solidus]|uniref:Amiloride-sensitive sodium channel n=1 Tax=Schistocephalus solidus TaxID=70667 RepID=A0A3P7CGG9_SCHSO|nr:unnamed protein product [Schistocephalus solidus]